jgi:DNA-binding NarL/FixJ family response regulator
VPLALAWRQSGTWSAQYRAACRLTAEEARSEAERISHELARLCQAPLPNGLTEREGAVIRLVAEGLSTADIATRLVVSPRTVHAHLRSDL